MLKVCQCVDISTNFAKAILNKTVDALAQIKAETPNCTTNHCVLHDMHSQFKKKKVGGGEKGWPISLFK